MIRIGLLILAGSLAIAALLLVLWFIGFLGHIGGGLIHLLLILGLLVGGTGSIVGAVLVIIGKARS